jgi:hypothetical protein
MKNVGKIYKKKARACGDTQYPGTSCASEKWLNGARVYPFGKTFRRNHVMAATALVVDSIENMVNTSHSLILRSKLSTIFMLPSYF